MPTDSFTSALERLDPASRALLDLSLRRGMRTEEIAEVLGAEPESVEASRDEALRRIAREVGMEDDDVRDRLAEMPVDEWNGNGWSSPAAAPEAEAKEPEPAAEPPVATTKTEKRRGSLWPLLLGLLLTAAVIVAIALGTGDNGDQSTVSQPSQPSQPSAKKPAPAPAPNGATKLNPVGSVKGSGQARVSGGKLRLTATLPRGAYEVWLYNSILDARSIAKAKGPRLNVTAKLPGKWKRFRYVDVSRERRDGNLSHSGESVLRVPTKTLSRR
jgi:pyruvate/2-oxoglutarate dehydrogenase complex dihydrolipoamide acyltransferase (E2) component